MARNRGLKTYTVEKVKLEYKGEELYNGDVCNMPYLDILAEHLTEEYYDNKVDDTRDEIPQEEWDAKIEEILAELEEDAEYYEEEEVDGDYYIQMEYYASVAVK